MGNSNSEDDALVRLSQIIGDRRKGITPIVPVSRSTWWNWVAAGRAPKPVKVGGSGATFWRRSDINAMLGAAR
jgi:prophage regulatory protein